MHLCNVIEDEIYIYVNVKGTTVLELLYEIKICRRFPRTRSER